MTYEDIKKVNEQISLTPLTRKQKQKDGTYTDIVTPYAEVPQKVKAFRMLYPEGSIEPEIVTLNESCCVIKTKVYGDGKLLGIGHACEFKNSSSVNADNYVENCETSSVGRALSFIGIGSDKSIASYEEMKNEVEKELREKGEEQKPKQDKPVSTAQINFIKSLYNLDNIVEILKVYQIEKLEDLTSSQASQLIEKANGKKRNQ